MATPERARKASARGAVGTHKCRGDPRHLFPPTTPTGHVVDACTTRCVDFYGHIRLWMPQNAHDWPVHAARLGRKTVTGTIETGLHPPRLLVASWTHALPGVWTSMATYFYGHPRTRSNGQCTRRGWDAETLGGPPTLVCTHHARWSRRGRTHYLVCGPLWPRNSMATPEGARMASAHAAVGMHKCRGDPRHWFGPTTPVGRVVDARTTRRVDFYGHILLCPPQNAHKWPVHAARFGRRKVEGARDTGSDPRRPLVTWSTHVRPGVWTPMATYFYGHPKTRTNSQCTRRGWDAQMSGGPLTLASTHHAYWSRRGRMHHPVCGLLWPHTSMASPERARMGSARGAVGTHKC